MPWATEQNAGYYPPQSAGPILLAQPDIATPPASIPAGQSWTSGLLPSDGFKAIAVGLQSTQSGQISIQRYIDYMKGQTPQGAAVTASILAGVPVTCNAVDGLPFSCFTISVSNTGTGAATITNFAALLAAN
jgi:hypothetical protein